MKTDIITVATRNWIFFILCKEQLMSAALMSGMNSTVYLSICLNLNLYLKAPMYYYENFHHYPCKGIRIDIL